LRDHDMLVTQLCYALPLRSYQKKGTLAKSLTFKKFVACCLLDAYAFFGEAFAA